MAQNLAGQVTTNNRSNTRSEMLSVGEFTGDNRFRTLLDSQKLSNAGVSAWNTLKGALNPPQFLLRFRLARKLKAR